MSTSSAGRPAASRRWLTRQTVESTPDTRSPRRAPGRHQGMPRPARRERERSRPAPRGQGSAETCAPTLALSANRTEFTTGPVSAADAVDLPVAVEPPQADGAPDALHPDRYT